MANEMLGFSPGFYMAVGDAPFPSRRSSDTVRLYWHLTAPAARLLIEGLTGRLNRAGTPFSVKVLSSPEAFGRCDGGVLYLPQGKFEEAAPSVSSVYSEIEPMLGTLVPAFVRALAPGLGVAEQPAAGDESFGLHRCGALAEGIIEAHEGGKDLLEDRVAAVVARLARHGIDLECPHLNPGSSDAYELPDLQPASHAASRRQEGASPDALATTMALGRAIAHSAIWYEGRCNWVGALPTVRGRSVHGALGPDLYGGTAGVGLFLAELHGATGDEEERRAALGAIRQSLDALTATPDDLGVGLYSGWTGSAVAAARVGTLLGEDELVDGALALWRRSSLDTRREFDLFAGGAGAIIALLNLGQLLETSAFLPAALRLGEDLLSTAEGSPAGDSWPTPGAVSHANLTGLSHGAAGAALALSELATLTDDSRFRAAAERALAYERSWFDAKARNWPDLRHEPRRGQRRQGQRRFGTFWCHGAPGIALSRLRIYELWGNGRCREELDSGLATTLAATEARLHIGDDFSLCHGLCGSADILLEASRVLDEPQAGWVELPLEVAEAGARLHGPGRGSWPCGVGSGQTPALMTGLAGIGFFYLRLVHPSATSPLLWRP